MAKQVSIKKAAVLNAAGKYSKVILTLIVNAVLARILTPEDFGVLAMMTVFTTFFTSLADMGFGAAIIQDKELTDVQVCDIFSFTVYMSLSLAGLFSLCAYPIAAFYHDSAYIPLCQFLSLSLLFNAMNMVPNGIMNREKRFASLAIRIVITYAASSAIAIVMAMLGAGYYSLAAQSVLFALSSLIWNLATVKPHFVLLPNLDSVRRVMGYSGWQFAFNLVTYFAENLDNLLTGRFFGSADLGYYSKAFSLTVYPVSNVAGVITPVLHPILSDYQDQWEVIYRKFLQVAKLLAYASIFITSVCVLASNEVVTIMFGENWGPSAECFFYLSLAILPMMMNSPVASVFQAIGNTRLLFINCCINTVVTVLAILGGVFLGGDILSLSIYVGFARLFHMVTAYYMLIKLGMHYSMWVFLGEFRKVYIVAATMAACVAGWLSLEISISNIFLSMLVKTCFLGTAFTLSMFSTGDGGKLLNRLNRNSNETE